MAVTAKDIQDKADGVILPFINLISAFQDNWIKTHKGYWQGIKTPSAVPQDGLDTQVNTAVKPVGDPNEKKAWAEVSIAIPEKLPCSVEIFVHEGPQGKGYTVKSYITFGSQTFVKNTGFGAGSTTSNWKVNIPRNPYINVSH